MQHYESRIGQVLHILGKQFFNTFPWGCKSRALDTDIQLLSGIIAGVWKKGLSTEEHELVRCTVHELDFHKYPGSSPTRHFHVLGPAAVASERPVKRAWLLSSKSEYLNWKVGEMVFWYFASQISTALLWGTQIYLPGPSFHNCLTLHAHLCHHVVSVPYFSGCPAASLSSPLTSWLKRCLVLLGWGDGCSLPFLLLGASIQHRWLEGD